MASTYTKPSGRVHFEKLFDDVLYPRIAAENRLWNGPVETLVRYAWYAAIVFIAVWSVSNLDIPWFYFLDAHVQAADLITRMIPPYWPFFLDIIQPLVETLHIATLGTVFTIFLAFPVAILSARNTTFNKTTWFIGRFILVTSRSVNTVVWGLLFVAIFGPGPVAGIFSVAARSIGFVGKLIAEAIEEIDVGTVEAIEASGLDLTAPESAPALRALALDLVALGRAQEALETIEAALRKSPTDAALLDLRRLRVLVLIDIRRRDLVRDPVTFRRDRDVADLGELSERYLLQYRAPEVFVFEEYPGHRRRQGLHLASRHRPLPHGTP